METRAVRDMIILNEPPPLPPSVGQESATVSENSITRWVVGGGSSGGCDASGF
jgi:hypothetical protein